MYKKTKTQRTTKKAQISWCDNFIKVGWHGKESTTNQPMRGWEVDPMGSKGMSHFPLSSCGSHFWQTHQFVVGDFLFKKAEQKRKKKERSLPLDLRWWEDGNKSKEKKPFFLAQAFLLLIKRFLSCFYFLVKNKTRQAIGKRQPQNNNSEA